MSRVLVAEDDPHILRVICMWLSRQGHDVAEARNGVAALDQLRARPADVLISDVNMPQMDGLQLIEQAVRLEAPPGGIVVLTNRWDHAEIRTRLSKWGVHVLPKPFSPTKLADLIGELTAPGGPDAAAGDPATAAAASGDGQAPEGTPEMIGPGGAVDRAALNAQPGNPALRPLSAAPNSMETRR
jgi:CheY-like chemotaxis protein